MDYDGDRDTFLLTVLAEARGCIEEQWRADMLRPARQHHRDRMIATSSLDLARKARTGTTTASFRRGVEQWGSLNDASTRPTTDDRPAGDGSGTTDRDPWASASIGHASTRSEQPTEGSATGQQRVLGSWAALEANAEALRRRLEESVSRPGSDSSYDPIADRGLDSDGNLDVGQFSDFGCDDVDSDYDDEIVELEDATDATAVPEEVD